MLPSFALPFRHHRQAAQPLKPTASALVELQWDQPAAMSRRCNLSDCVCCAPGADAVCALAADAVKGLAPGMLPSFALPFRHHRQAAQPLKPTASALVELQWDQPAAMSRRCNLSDCVCCAPGADAVCALAADAVKGLAPGMLPSFALPFRHHRQAAQPLKPTAGALVEPQWDQPTTMSRRCNLSDCVCCAPDADAICARRAKMVKGLVRAILPNFPLPFRNRQQTTQSLRPPAAAQVEFLRHRPAAIDGPVPGLQNLALPFRHHPHAVQSLRLPGGEQVEPRWNQPAISGGHYLGCCVFCAPGVEAVCASAADAVKGLLPGILPNFPLSFRHHRQAAQPLKPTAGALVEPQWDQPATMSGARLLTFLRST